LDISPYHCFDIPSFTPLSALCKSIADGLVRVIDLSADASRYEDARLFPIVHGGIGHAEHEPCLGSCPVTYVLWGGVGFSAVSPWSASLTASFTCSDRISLNSLSE